MPKTIIYYHRSYRKITRSGLHFFLPLVLLSLSFSAVIFLFLPFFTNKMGLFTKFFLSAHTGLKDIDIVSQKFLYREIFFIDIYSFKPSQRWVSMNIIFSTVPLLFLRYTNRVKPISVYLAFLLVINLISSIYFIILADRFPYTATDFSAFYVKSVFCIWLFLPLILGAALFLLPTPISQKIILLFSAFVYSFIFCTLRYVIFLFTVHKFSAIYMAVLFFGFGPLIDFVYIVGIYSFYTSKLAVRLKSSEAVWKWSY